MKTVLFLIPLFALTVGAAYAEPLGNIQTSIIELSNNTATVQITWESDPSVSSYTIGCVSCFPHIVEPTKNSEIVMENVTSFPNSSIAMLYGIAYDLEGEIISAKQIFVSMIQ